VARHLYSVIFVSKQADSTTQRYMFFCASAVIAKTKHTTEKQLTFWFSEQHNPQSKCKTDVSIGRAPQQLSAD